MAGVADLIVVTGPPGAGKTTVAQALSGLFKPSALVCGDQFFAFIDQGYIAPWTAAAHRQNEIVVGAAAAAAGRLATGGYTVIYDGVIGPWFLETFGVAKGLARLHYAILLPPEELCLQRVRSRAGHGFRDLEAARHMYTEFATAEVDPRHLVVSTEDAAALASRLRHLVKAGTLRRSITHHDKYPEDSHDQQPE
jgi:adenylate kinase family enzyme